MFLQKYSGELSVKFSSKLWKIIIAFWGVTRNFERKDMYLNFLEMVDETFLLCGWLGPSNQLYSSRNILFPFEASRPENDTSMHVSFELS